MNQTPSEFFFQNVKRPLLSTLIRTIKYSYEYMSTTTDLHNSCNFDENDCSIDFFENGAYISDVTRATNVLLIISHNKFAKLLGFRSMDIFNDRVVLYDDACSEKVLSSIDLRGLSAKMIDGGFLFQLSTNTNFMPFSVSDLKNIIRIASVLHDDIENNS